jgi:succinyl-diaminopimelate desuccinylase
VVTRSEWFRFAEKVRLAIETSRHNDSGTGTSGLEVEFNILDADLTPVARVGYGPESRSFADWLHEERLPEWARGRFQLEVFHWMTEVTTRPFFSPEATAAEARLLEGVLLNTLSELRLGFGEFFFAHHGNIACPVEVNGDSIPDGWNLARQRYLRRCVELFGPRLATAGIHTNHSYPEALLSWDFVHLPLTERRGTSLEQYRNEVVIRATRLLRPLCPIFIAASACSPFAHETVEGEPSIVLTDVDSQRLLAFPNPESLDVPLLYASHEDYLRISYELVRGGVRFGANNWTPVRARSDVDPVNRNILATSEQLRELYRRGIYASGEHGGLEQAERTVIVENLCARVDLPMNRVEVRTDEGGDTFDLSIAKIALKDLLLLRAYGDPEWGAGFGYDATDVARARRNEEIAARDGLDGVIEDPWSGGQVRVRDLLGAMLEELQPLAEAMDVSRWLEPLREMAAGGPTPAERVRRWMGERLGKGARRTPGGAIEVPRDLMREWLGERVREVARDVRRIAADHTIGGDERVHLRPLIGNLDRMCHGRPDAPVTVADAPPPLRLDSVSDRTAEVLAVATDLVRIPSVTNCANERLEEVRSCARLIAGLLGNSGCELTLYEDGKYPSLVAGFPGALVAPITLSGHFDVVPPHPDDGQFEPRIEGDYFWGRGTADMKTVVASMLVWMRERCRSGPPYPPFNLLLVGNEENGEGEPHGTPHVLEDLAGKLGWRPEIMLVGERTGEHGDELYGSVCVANRGIVRLRVVARGRRGHTGTGAIPGDLLDRLIEVRSVLETLFPRHLTLTSFDGWESSARFPFLIVGQEGVYNITAGEGVLGLEIRPIPGDDVHGLVDELQRVTRELGQEVVVETLEAGVACPGENPHLGRLIDAVAAVSGEPARVGRKKPGSSARFAPGGNAVVWGQTGIGPHAPDERHFIPSIEPYLKVLDRFAALSMEHPAR